MNAYKLPTRLLFDSTGDALDMLHTCTDAIAELEQLVDFAEQLNESVHPANLLNLVKTVQMLSIDAMTKAEITADIKRIK